MTTILTSDPGKAVFQNAAVEIAVNHLPDIRKEIPLEDTVVFMGDIISPVADEDWSVLK